MKESDIQFDIIKWLESNGWYVVKHIQTNKNGFPDLSAYKQGFCIFIEVKTPTGKVAELQKYRHKQLAQFGFSTIITTNLKDLQDVINTISQQIHSEWLIYNPN
jgi:Holliday junction resolvase